MNPVAILLRAGCLLLTLPLLCAPQNANSRIDQLYQQGVEAAKQSDFAAAERAYRAGLEAAQSSDNKVWTARLHRSLAEVREARREWKDAAAEYTQALALYEELGDKSGANAVSMSLARGWAGVSDHSKSIEYANHALAGYLALSESANAAKALDIMGQEHAKNSQYGDAERALTQAVSLYEKLNDERGKGKVLGSLADLDRRTSRFNSALDNGFRALDTDEKFADHQEIAKVLDVLGTAFLDMGQYENARHYFERGLEERRRFGLSQHLSFSYRNMCAALFYSDNYAEAVDYCRKSLQEGMNAGNFREIAGSTLNIGISELQLGRMGDARHDLEQALAISEEHAYRQQEGSALYNLGNLSRTAGDLDKSLEYHQRALEVREQDRDRRAVVRSLSRIGLVLEERGDLQGALAAHERALAQFESIGGEISDPVQYGAFRQTSVGLYPHYARVLVKLGRTWDALLISERSRAVGLSRMVALNGAAFLDLLQHDHAETWRQASADLARAGNALRVAMERAQVQAEPTDGRTRAMEAARARYFEAQKRLSDLRDRLFASTPALRAAQNPAPPTAAQLQAMAKSSPDTLFLEWMIVDDQSALVFALHAGALDAFELNHGTADLLSVSNSWRDALGRAGRSLSPAARRSADGKEETLAKELYTVLFSKLEPGLAAHKVARLAIVAEGPLLDIPFAALMTSTKARLIDQYAISNAVSLASLLRPPVRSKPVQSMLAVADPLGQGESRIVPPSGYSYDELPDARAEARNIAGMYAKSVFLAGPSAREQEVKKLLPQFEFLHFATHGILDAHDGLNSGLLMATESADGSEDGILHAWEVAELSLTARLVVLSACDTGLGKERQGDGLLGMAWSFLAAGAPRVVASLWRVDDAASREFMTGFYKDVKTGIRLDDAMRKSMLAMRNGTPAPSPYYWSAFQILGNAGGL